MLIREAAQRWDQLTIVPLHYSSHHSQVQRCDFSPIAFLYGLLYLASISLPLVGARSTLFEQGTVISFDEETQVPRILHNTSVLVTGDRITAIFSSNATGDVAVPDDVERVSAVDKIISPGFINTHHHSWQTAFRTLAPDITLSEYLLLYGQVAGSTLLDANDVYYGQLESIFEALNGGVNTILEHAHSTFSNDSAAASLNAAVDGGLRMFWCYTVGGLEDFPVQEQLANFHELNRPTNVAGSPVEVGISYDLWSAADPEEVQSVVDTIKKSNISALTTHYLSGPWVALSPPGLLDSLGVLNGTFPVVFSHTSYITAEEAALLRQRNQYISITPESEMHYGHDHYRTPYLKDQGSLGIDTHFSYSADILTQARLWLQSTRLRFFRRNLDDWVIPSTTPMAVRQAFLLATRNGGLALRRPDLGVVLEGAKADLFLWDGTGLNLLGWTDPIAAIMLHANIGDIEAVMVDGEWKKRNGSLVMKVDKTEVDWKFLESARRIQEVLAAKPKPVVEGKYLEGISYGDTEKLDVVRGKKTGY